MTYIKHKKYREGEEHIQANGMNAKIIEYKYSNDMIIEFEDGFIKEHVSYRDFINGKVTYTNKRYNIDKRVQNKIGERNVNHNNLVMTIVDYRNANDIDVLFEDGVLVEHAHYVAFFQGYLKHPTKKTIRWPFRANKKCIGKTIRTLDNHYRIIDVHDDDSIDVINDEKVIFYNISYSCLKCGILCDAI